MTYSIFSIDNVCIRLSYTKTYMKTYLINANNILIAYVYILTYVNIS